MRHFLCAAALFLLSLTAGSARVKPGIEVLRDRHFAGLEGKRVGLVTNPSGVDSQLNSTIDILFEAENVKLVALFAPEHGVRGDVYAGGKVESGKDEHTGLPVHSLFGSTRQPTAEMLRGIVDSTATDLVLCGDMNDTPASWAYRTLVGDDLHDVYPEVYRGYMNTYNKDRFLFRIDHVMYRGNLRPVSLVRGDAITSDHYPQFTTFEY